MPADVPAPEPRLSLATLCGLGVPVGIIGGLGAVVFRALIGLVHNLLFLGHLGTFYDAQIFTPESPWGAAVILVPMIGSFGVTVLVTTFAPEAQSGSCPRAGPYRGSGAPMRHAARQ